MKSRLLQITLLLAAILSPGLSRANEVKQYPISDFYKLDSFYNMKISPGGEYLAATVPQEKRTVLVILRLSDMKITGTVVLQEKAHVTSFYWVNNERILYYTALKQGRLSAPQNQPGIYGVNADGSKQGLVHGADMISTLVQDDENVLVTTRLSNHKGGMSAQKMNAVTGVRTGPMTFAPEQNCDLEANSVGEVHFAYCSYSQQITQRFFYKANPKSPWELINKEVETGQAISVRGYSAGNKKAYFQIEEEKGPDSIYEFDMATKQKTLLMRDEDVDPETFLTSPVDGSVYAIRFNDGLPRTSFINKTDPFALDLKKLLNAFPEDDVYPTSFTKDGRLGVYVVTSDTRPPEFYLYDRDSAKVSIIASSAAWFKSEDMSVMTPVKFKARDGLEISGFVTVPKGSNGKNLPTIINPHGGPFGVHDNWGFNAETQMLANRGYVVMQVNFRGSSNYGKNFTVKGYHGWGRAMQDDLTDATGWLIKQGIADPKRICIYGASYGAYAALMGAAKEPNLYQCAVGNVGVYDLAKVYTDDSDVNTAGRRFFDMTMGSEDFDQYSPNLVAHKIKIPVLLAAGDTDYTAPPAHTRRMQEALERNHVPVETVIYPKEGHGNYLMANKLDFAQRLLAFFDRHIGKPRTSGN